MQEVKVITIEDLFDKIVPNIHTSEEQVISFLKICVADEEKKKKLGRKDLDFSMNLPFNTKIVVPLSQVKNFLKTNVGAKGEKESELSKFLTGKSKVMKPPPPPPPPGPQKKEEIVAKYTPLPTNPIKETKKK